MPKTLLLADNSQTIQRVVALSFAGHDVVVVPVGDGDAAVEVLSQSRPDVVLADIAMPGRNGYELADYMRRSSRLADVPVLLLASAFEAVDHDRLQAVGARGVLSKPFEPGVIVGRVRELLREVDPGAAGSALTAPAPERGNDGAPGLGDLARRHDIPGSDAKPSAHAAPLVSEPPAGLQDLPLHSSASPEPAPNLDRYFEQLDRAFTELRTTRRSPADSEPTAETEPHHTAAIPAEPPAVPAGRVVSLTDAFSALLAAESGGAPEGPALLADPSAVAVPPIDMDALVEQVTSRVLAGMSDRIVRETVTDVIVATAERLVRDEIERIKRDAQ